ncbi:uncharacterized protein LOC112554141 [Pomacea canaliculata]|uniref:uncharacterized protein LOC112554141 n=1 Tax=Pomacea canaliculata TaxID=400727 RepID=UPI000D72B974|nr:uncharacterized protein LOC112554141 [Pomacea canaliculata]XP_025077547.1 uncharacterized protein LOC112554141 [Pomacea canaliculata]
MGGMDSQKEEGSCCTQSADVLRAIEDDFWRWRMRDAPEFASSVGDCNHSDILESFTPSVFQARKVQVQSYLDKLQGVDKSQLTQTQILDLDIFTDHLQTYKEGAVFDMYQSMNPVNFLESVNADPGRLQVIAPFSCFNDFVSYLERLRLLPTQIDEKIALMKQAVALGNTLNKVSVVSVPAQIHRLVSVNNQQSPFFVPAFTTRLQALPLPESHREELRAKAEDAVVSIKKALVRLATFLEQDYLPATRPTCGVHGWREGKRLYEQCLRYHTSTNMTPHQVHDLGLQEISRIEANMKAVLQRLGFEGTIRQFCDSLRGHPNYRKKTPEDLLATFTDYIFNVIYPKLPLLFKDIPNLPLRVVAMPYDGPLGEYLGGTPDGKTPGTFYANVTHPEKSPTINIMALVLHETVPGHHLQSIYSMSANLPPYRAFVEDSNYHRMPATFPINTAYLEGWALYSEYLGEEMGVYTDDYMLMGRYSEELFRACRLVVDTGLHYFEWERERAIQFLMNNTGESRDSIAPEVDRYLTWPGQATAYKIGEIKLKELRQKATDALGDRFDIRDFHSVILQNGGMSLSLLERLVDTWIASHLYNVSSSGEGECSSPSQGEGECSTPSQ